MNPEQQGSSNQIRILLRNSKTRFYLQRSGEWSDNRKDARDFGSALDAYHWARQNSFSGLEILFACEDPKYDLVTLTT